MKRLFLLLFILQSAGLLAQDDAVMLSDQCLYLGRKSFLQPGAYNAYRLGLNDNSISSFHVPKGMALQVFEQDRLRGRTETFYSSVGCLSALWNNRISSVKVFYMNDPGNGSGGQHGGNNGGGQGDNGGSPGFGGGSGNDLPPQGDRVIFYRDLKYSGMAKSVGAGNFFASSLGFLANNVSSIYVPAGYSIKVNDRNGNSRTFTGSVANLSQYGWDNRIYSGFIDINGGESGSGGGNTPPPQGNRVIFYRDMKYSGMAKDMGAGNFNSGTLGFLAGNVSSVYIPSGTSVRVSDRSGNTQTFTASISNLAQYGWDNRIHSGFITSPGFGGGNDGGQGGNETVILFNDVGYQGNFLRCNEGRIRHVGDASDNQITSIQLPQGYTITVYDGPNLTGSNRTFTSSVSNLVRYGWNDRISSVYVFRL